MKDEDFANAYLVSRRYRSRSETRYRKRKPRRAAGVLIAVLLLLTAGICLLVVFLPKMTASVGAAPVFKGKTFYMLATAKVSSRTEALIAAQSAAERGGGGYIYNDGEYRIIAAAYDRESDAKTLVSVNADSHYFALTVPSSSKSGDKRVLEYIVGDWFLTVTTAAAELDRGNITESAAEHAVAVACRKLCALADNAESAYLKHAVTGVCDIGIQTNRTVLSYIRYVQVAVLVAAHTALS
ncbi:MAG: hypothetical protein J1G01_04135 [Clostridiales bacterium]|nr:hypothetical protein [Clostridiales bacterium]